MNEIIFLVEEALEGGYTAPHWPFDFHRSRHVGRIEGGCAGSSPLSF